MSISFWALNLAFLTVKRPWNDRETTVERSWKDRKRSWNGQRPWNYRETTVERHWNWNLGSFGSVLGGFIPFQLNLVSLCLTCEHCQQEFLQAILIAFMHSDISFFRILILLPCFQSFQILWQVKTKHSLAFRRISKNSIAI